MIDAALFDRVVADTIAAGGGATIDRLTDAVLTAGVFDADWRKEAVRRLAKVFVRRRVKAKKDARGMPVYFNVGPSGEDGEDGEDREDGEDNEGAPVYKPLPLFDLSEFEAAARPYLRTIEHHVAVLEHLRSAARARGVQLQLPLWLPQTVAA